MGPIWARRRPGPIHWPRPMSPNKPPVNGPPMESMRPLGATRLTSDAPTNMVVAAPNAMGRMMGSTMREYCTSGLRVMPVRTAKEPKRPARTAGFVVLGFVLMMPKRGMNEAMAGMNGDTGTAIVIIVPIPAAPMLAPTSPQTLRRYAALPEVKLSISLSRELLW